MTIIISVASVSFTYIEGVISESSFIPPYIFIRENVGISIEKISVLRVGCIRITHVLYVSVSCISCIRDSASGSVSQCIVISIEAKFITIRKDVPLIFHKIANTLTKIRQV